MYGNRCSKVINLIKNNPSAAYLLSSHSLDIKAQIEYALKNELAFTVSDILLRRLTLGLSESLGEDAVSTVAEYIRKIFALTNSEIDLQINEYYENVIKLRRVNESKVI